MKTIISILIIIILGTVIWVMMCNKSGNRMMDVYNHNVKTLEKFWKHYENEDLEELENMMAGNYESYFYPINEPKGVKSSKYEELERMERFFDIVDNISLDHIIMLPGIDSANLMLDGSVRMYSGWSFDLNDKKVSLSAYGFYDFVENKILLSHEWYDRSGIGLEIKKVQDSPSLLLINQVMEMFDMTELEAREFLKPQSIE